MSKLLRTWRASFVRRWHTNVDLCDTVDYISGHQCRVALIVLQLWPDASRDLIVAALTHDQGEAAVGDIPRPVKRAKPELANLVSAAEDDERVKQGFGTDRLSDSDIERLKLADDLDAILWMLRHKPGLRNYGAWDAYVSGVTTAAVRAGAGAAVCDVINRAVCAAGERA